MSVYVSANERIGDLRAEKELSQAELSKMIGVAPSQMCRIENGSIKNISSDILMKLAKVFNVSTDYILGLIKIRTTKSYDISELGLSESAVRNIVLGRVDVEILNCLIEHKSFPYFMIMMKNYFNDDAVAGVETCNKMIDIVTSTLGDFVKDNPQLKAEVNNDIRFISSHKMGKHEAVLEKLKSILLVMLKDIKENLKMKAVLKPKAVADAEFMSELRKQMNEMIHSKKIVTQNDVAGIVSNMVAQKYAFSDIGMSKLKELAIGMMDGSLQVKN